MLAAVKRKSNSKMDFKRENVEASGLRHRKSSSSLAICNPRQTRAKIETLKQKSRIRERGKQCQSRNFPSLVPCRSIREVLGGVWTVYSDMYLQSVGLSIVLLLLCSLFPGWIAKFTLAFIRSSNGVYLSVI